MAGFIELSKDTNTGYPSICFIVGCSKCGVRGLATDTLKTNNGKILCPSCSTPL